MKKQTDPIKLPEFTVVANRKNGTKDDEIKFLESAQKYGNKSSLYKMWLNAGKPDIKTFLNANTGSFEFDIGLDDNGNLKVKDKGTLNLPELGKFTLNDLNHNAKEQLSYRHTRNNTVPEIDLGLDQFLTELPHAQQFNEAENKLNHVLKSENDRETHGGKGRYLIHGTIENDAHSVREPNIRDYYNNQPDYSTRVQYFDDNEKEKGGYINKNNMKIKTRKDHMEFKKKFLMYFMENGGSLPQISPELKALGQQVSGVLPIAQTAIRGVQDVNQQGRDTRKMMEQGMNTDTNPYMREGGLVEYEGASHEQGGIGITSDLIPTDMMPDAEVEGGETGFQLKKGGYIYSDKLGMGGMTFADKSKMIRDKYKREDNISQNTMELEMTKLSKANDLVKSIGDMKSQFMKRMGGNVKKYGNGGEFDPFEPSEGVPTKESRVLDLNGRPVASIRSFAVSDPVDTFKMPDMPKLSSSDNSTPSRGKRQPYNPNNIAIGLKAAALGKSFMDSIQPTEQERLQLNPNADEAIQISEGLGVNLQPAFNEIDLGINQSIQGARNVAGSAVTQQVLANSAIARGTREKANLQLTEQGMNNQLRANEAQIKARLGSEERGERIRQQVAQSQNDATNRGFDRDFFSNLSQVGTEFNKADIAAQQRANVKELAQLSIAEGTALLSSQYKDFTITEDLVDELKKGIANGTITDVDNYIKFKAAKK